MSVVGQWTTLTTYWLGNRTSRRGPKGSKEMKMPAWRWWVFIVFVVLFPIVFKPWWLALVSIAMFVLLASVLHPKSD